MDENSSDINLEFPSIQKQYNGYEIKLTNSNSSLNILIKNKNDFYCYKSNFDEFYLQEKFKSNISIEDIRDLIDNKEFKIENNGNNLKLILKNIEFNIEISLFETLNELNNKIKTKDILIIIIIIIMTSIIILNIFSLFINNKN